MAATYQNEENSESITNGYRLVRDATAPLTSSGIRSIIRIINTDGEVVLWSYYWQLSDVIDREGV